MSIPTGIIQPIQTVIVEANTLKGETKYIGYICKIFNESVAMRKFALEPDKV